MMWLDLVHFLEREKLEGPVKEAKRSCKAVIKFTHYCFFKICCLGRTGDLNFS